MANVKRIEALADCIGFLNDYGNPESVFYQLRNPGACRAYSFKQLGAVDKNGYRIFTSHHWRIQVFGSRFDLEVQRTNSRQRRDGKVETNVILD